MKTKFTVIDTKDMTVLFHNNAFIELTPKYLKWLVDYKCKTDEYQEEQIYNNIIIDKKAIASIILFRITSTGNWSVQVDYYNDKVMVHFKSFEYAKAKKLFDDIIQWMYNV